MKRQNKFRIGDILRKEYTYAPNNQFLIGLDGQLFDGEGNPYDENHIIEQFTELKDKNGKEIYEGDFISYTPFNQPDYKNTVTTVPTLNNFHWFEELESMIADNPNKCDIEIIGNIFENQSLLNK